MDRQFTDRSRYSLDDIKYMALDLYGSLPLSCNYVTKVIDFTYSASGEFSQTEELEKPIFATHIQVGKELADIGKKVYVSMSATDDSDDMAVDLGNDGDIMVGNIIKYIKVSGNASQGANIRLTITGFELGY